MKAKTYRFLCYFMVTHPFFSYIGLLEEDLPNVVYEGDEFIRPT